MQSLSDADFRDLVERIKSDDSKYVDGDLRTLLDHCQTLRDTAKRLTDKIDFRMLESENVRLVNELDDVVRRTAVCIPA